MSSAVEHYIWGKLSRDEPPVVHPLVCHLLDAGHVAAAMWHHCLQPGLRTWLSSAVGLAEQDAANWVAFWAGLHDIGKATPAFQCKAETAAPAVFRRLCEQGYDFRASRDGPAHGLLAKAILDDMLADPETPGHVDRPLARSLAALLSGHHGVFPLPTEVGKIDRRWHIGSDRWETLRRSLLKALADCWGIADLPRPQTPAPDQQSWYMALAGLVSVADWIASNERYFPYAGLEVQLADYVAALPQRAAQALEQLDWTGWRPPADAADFEGLFGFAPNAMQVAAAEVADWLDEPGLVVIEAPMGLGKTEAAFHLLYECLRKFGHQGSYVALPTQATSNQMFRRLGDFLRRAFPDDRVNLQLLHGRAILHAEYERLRPSGVSADAGPAGSLIAAEWFAAPKRGLLAGFGAGTIDQSLLAVLQTRHMFVRLFGLAGKVVVLDEVHAYDTYTSELLQHLLRWLGRLRCTVVLLSATLPRRKRLELVAAYSASVKDKDVPYPRITAATATASLTLPIPTADGRTIQLATVPREPDELAQAVRTALVDGGCAACICNTVGRAQELYQAIRRGFADDPCEVMLLHARFPFGQRRDREDAVVGRFGKPGWTSGTRPSKAALVATQIIEQSLDLDFDLMATDLAPVDLVLQRAGRLHRHERIGTRPNPRPPQLGAPQLWIAQPEVGTDGVPRFGVDEYIYERYLLLRSYLTLLASNIRAVQIPDDLEPLVESVYGNAPPAALSPAWQQALAEAERELRRGQQEDRWDALCRQIPPPAADDLLDAFSKQLEEDDPTVHRSLQAATRKALPSVVLICLHAREGSTFLDSAAARPVDLDHPPAKDQVHELIDNSVSIMHQGIVHRCLEQLAPPAWQQVPVLRHCHPIIFENGRTTLGRYTIQLHPELGIVIGNTQPPDEGD